MTAFVLGVNCSNSYVEDYTDFDLVINSITYYSYIVIQSIVIVCYIIDLIVLRNILKTHYWDYYKYVRISVRFLTLDLHFLLGDDNWDDHLRSNLHHDLPLLQRIRSRMSRHFIHPKNFTVSFWNCSLSFYLFGGILHEVLKQESGFW